MRRGDFEAAWRISDEILRGGPNDYWGVPPHKRQLWNGEDLAGKRVLVRCDNGLGDTIQFARYLPMVKAAARELHVAAQPALFDLLASMNCVDSLIDRDSAHEIAFDAAAEIIELPHVYRTTISSIPAAVPYLHVPGRPRRRDNVQRRIGLVWQSGEWDERRSVPFRMLQPLFSSADAEFFILQYEAEKAGWHCGYGWRESCSTVVETAAAMLGLDLMISVDTMTAHLAGALGITTWVLLHSDPDWRWLDGTDESPWYPTMRLFRQRRAGEWQPVIESVCDEICRLYG
jgi:hypothetical protein